MRIYDILCYIWPVKKVLVISYFFPPCSLTGAQRPASWAKYFSEFGIYPHIITRKWERPLLQYADEGFATSEGEEIEKGDHASIYRLPYKSSWRDRLWVKYGNNRFVFLRRLLTIYKLITQNFCISFSPYLFIYKKAEKLIQEEKFDAVLICGNPFDQFQIGYYLHKKYGIPWIADYRDAWTTSEIDLDGRSSLFKFFSWYDSFFEKKWVSSAAKISSVSKPLAEDIGAFVGRPYFVVENGYEEGMFDEVKATPKNSIFTVSYIGTLYPGQKIELFLAAFEKWVREKNLSPQDCMINCAGLELDAIQARRVRSFSSFLEPYLNITGRVPQKDVLRVEVSSHVLLYVGWLGYRGIVPSKIYEYCASETPVLVAPADMGEVDRIVKESKSGIAAIDENEIIRFLDEQYMLYKNKENSVNHNSDYIVRLSRRYQTKILADSIHEILS